MRVYQNIMCTSDVRTANVTIETPPPPNIGFLPIVSGTFSAGGPRRPAAGRDQTSTAVADAGVAVDDDNTRARRRGT